MGTFGSYFLRAKHWQVFLVLIVEAFVGMAVSFSSIDLDRLHTTEAFAKSLLLQGIGIEVAWIGFLGWLWFLGVFLSSLVDPSLRLKTGFFRFSIIYPAVYVIVFCVGLGVLFRINKPGWFVVVFPFHLFAMYCMIYTLYFVSKNMVMAEVGKPASFYDYAGPFFLIWFFPLGIWFIQPRINQLYEQAGKAAPYKASSAAQRD